MRYKDASPAETVESIRSILATVGIEVEERHFRHSDVAYSCRISLADAELAGLDIGTNGKGLTPEYARASGYAEFMERLQNKMLYNAALRYLHAVDGVEPLPFRFFPDEELVESTGKEFAAVVRRLFPRLSVDGYTATDRLLRYRTVPYADLTAGTTCDVPVVLARVPGSTGMCAGNTPAEAIMQGLCEIYERYVLQRLYTSPFAPPRFPDGYFDGTEAGARMAALGAEGYRCEALDLSLGGRYPVAGMLLTDPAGRKVLRLGSDLDASIALQRCITEAFQGMNEAVDASFTDYSDAGSAVNDDSEMKRQYARSLRNGTGRYPDIVVGDTPACGFTPWRWRRSGDSAADLQGECGRLSRVGLHLLVRDNSFLGFCTCHVIVPGLSELDEKLKDVSGGYLAHLGTDEAGRLSEDASKEWPLYNIKACSDAALMEPVWSHLSHGYGDVMLTPWNTAPSNSVNRNLLLSLLEFSFGKSSCAGHLGDFIKEREAAGLVDNDYLKCLQALMSHDVCRDGASPCECFPPELVGEVYGDISRGIMRNFRFPTCFRCSDCPVADGCRLHPLIDLERRIQTFQTVNIINQAALCSLVNLEHQ